MDKQFIKKSFIWKIIVSLHDLVYFPEQILLFKRIKSNPDCIVVVGTPTYNNLGDHLIALKEVELLKNCFLNKRIIEVPTQAFKRNPSKFAEWIGNNTLIIITGGGWMGDLWPEDEYRMQLMLHTFHNKSIIIFPQTVYYDSIGTNSEIFDSANKVYSNCKDLKMLFRESNSYKFALDHFNVKHERIYLTPDVALYGVSDIISRKSKKIGICLRSDRENIRKGKNVTQSINDWSKKNNWTSFHFSTIASNSIPVWLRRNRLTKLQSKIKDAEIIVTDRLHGMILAVLCGCKCIALDNRTHKVSGVYETWLIDNKRVELLPENHSMEMLTDALDRICRNNATQEGFVLKMEQEFSTVKRMLKGKHNETKKNGTRSNPQ